jgi:hypothetical protein
LVVGMTPNVDEQLDLLFGRRSIRANTGAQVTSVIPVACVCVGHPRETKPPGTRFSPEFV